MINQFKEVIGEYNSILILGFGKEGRSSYNFLRGYFKDIHLTIADINSNLKSDSTLCKDENITLLLGENYQEKLDDFDLIIKSPGVKIINLSDSIIKKISSQTDLFLKCYKDRVIGVTGTKGKSTTSSLVKHMLSFCGKNSILLGNIGVPAFEMIPEIKNNSIIVYELSAHQLEFVNFSPHIAILLNIFPEHLDYFDTLKDYVKAKENIFRYQNNNDILITYSGSDGISNLNHGNVKYFNDKFELTDLELNNGSLPLKGDHNVLNIKAALLAISAAGANINNAMESLRSFERLPHRLEYIGEFAGIKFVNDSISTIPQSTIEALKTYENVDTLILGGYDRGLEYNYLSDFLLKSRVSRMIFLGNAGKRMYELLSGRTDKELFISGSMEDAFKVIASNTKKGGICLLSPAAASYDQFHNFEHRGDTFKLLAANLANRS